MKAGGASSEWHEQAAKAEEFLIEKQDPAAITFDAEGKLMPSLVCPYTYLTL